MAIPERGTLFNQHRIDHIEEQRKKARVMLREMSHKLALRLSYFEVYDLMIGAIEDEARQDVAEIRRLSAEVTAKCQRVTQIDRMLREWQALREAVASGNAEAAQTAFDACEEWVDFAFGAASEKP